MSIEWKKDLSLRQSFYTCYTFIVSLICPTNLRSFHWQPSWLTSGRIGSTKRFDQSSFVGTGTEFFGELYGSAIDSRIARDFMEVPIWLKGGPEPSTVSETMFSRGPSKDYADATICGVQRRERLAHERKGTRFSFGTEV